MSLICSLLGIPHAAFAQALDEANALIQQVIKLNDQGRYSEAIPLAQRVLAIQEKTLGPEHPNVVTSLDNLAQLYTFQGQYANAKGAAEHSEWMIFLREQNDAYNDQARILIDSALADSLSKKLDQRDSTEVRVYDLDDLRTGNIRRKIEPPTLLIFDRKTVVSRRWRLALVHISVHVHA
jgi:tetratricopeptide (TPR) repeat protein